MNHLTPEELIDAVDGTLDPLRQTHLATCETCRDEAARVRSVLHNVQALDVPEPSPLFWEYFSNRVRQTIDHEPAPTRDWLPHWIRWPVLVPTAALALLVIALSSIIARTPVRPTTTNISTRAASDDDVSTASAQEWAIVTELVGPVAIERAHEAGIALNPGDADRMAQELSSDEQRELVRLIKEEMDKSGG
jgi:hypothetical protein